MTASATTTGDPRSRDDGLGWVTRAVFSDARIAVTVDAEPPAGHTVVVRYAVVPSVARARFLLPLGRPGALSGADRGGAGRARSGGGAARRAGRAELGTPVHAAFGVRPPDPNHKPTLQLFDDRGEPRGYAKIGWNDATRALVTAEAAALRECVGRRRRPGPPAR